MDVLLVVACGLLGLAVGPFVNLLVDRVPGREPLLPWQARCPAASEDEPHVGRGARGWARLLVGRCPGCGRRLSLRYALVGIATGALFAAAALRLGADWALPAYLVLFGSLVAVTLIDLEHFIIPNRIVYPTIFVSLVLLTMAAVAEDRFGSLGHAAVGAGISWGLLLVVHLVSPAGMGFGDVRLAFLLGLFLGWLRLALVFTGLFLGFLLGAVTGVVLILTGRRQRQEAIPFGPFLAGGTVLAVLAGAPISRWLLGS